MKIRFRFAQLCAGAMALACSTPANAGGNPGGSALNLQYGPTAEIHFKTGTSGQALDIFYPSAAAFPTSRPIVILIHGGGFTNGTKAGFNAPFRDAMTAAGFAVVSLDYRLDLGGFNVGQVEDVQLAIRWLRFNAPSLGLNGHRICTNGWSAGGTLAVVAGALHTIYPGDMDHFYPKQSVLVNCVADNSGVTLDKVNPASTTPLDLVDATSPPFFITHGTRGTPAFPNGDGRVDIVNAERLVAKLDSLGKTETHIFYDGGHVMEYLSSTQVHDYYSQEIEFFKRYLLP